MKDRIGQALQKIKNACGEAIFSPDNTRFKGAIADELPGFDVTGVHKRIVEARDLGVYIRLQKAADTNDLAAEQFRLITILRDDGIDETLATDIVSAFATLFVQESIAKPSLSTQQPNMLAVAVAKIKSQTQSIPQPKALTFLKSTQIEEIRGNTVGNIANGGFVTMQDDWIYYSSMSDDNKLYKIRANGAGKQKLSDDGCSFINVVGDWIYYRNNGDICYGHGQLCKISTDGTVQQKLDNGNCEYINVVNNWIYYGCSPSEFSADGSPMLYKMRTDGTDRQKLSDTISLYVSVVGGWVYYLNNDGLNRMRTDGSDRQKLNDERCHCFNIVGEWVYYTYKGLHRIRIDGSSRQKLIGREIEHYNVVDDWVYYCDKWELYKVRTDGTDNQTLDSDRDRLNGGYVNIIGEWVYYRYYVSSYRDESPYRIQMDGSYRHLFPGEIITDTNVADGWVYYDIKENMGLHSLSRLRLDGKVLQKLNGDYATGDHTRIEYINVVDDWVYYSRWTLSPSQLYVTHKVGSNRYKFKEFKQTKNCLDEVRGHFGHDDMIGTLYRIRLDGADKQIIISDIGKFFNIVNGWIFFCNYNDKCSLYKIRTNGKNKKKINGDISTHIKVVGDWVFYCNGVYCGNIFKINTTGTNRLKLNDDSSKIIRVEDDWVYYENIDDDKKLYRIRADGTDRQPVE
jgi:hypothetical protein